MANPVEILPLLVVALLLIGAQGGDVQSLDVRLDGTHSVTDVEDVLIVGGGTTTVPTDARLTGSVYVIGGDANITGTVDGDVVQLAGNLTIDETAVVTGSLRQFGGSRTVATDATIGSRERLETTLATEQSPQRAAAFFVAQLVVLSLVGSVLVRRWPVLLDNVGDSVRHHALVSGTVGLLASVTVVAVLTFMAFTLVLIPVSLVGLAVGVAVVGYSYIVFGYLVGRRLPVERPDLAVVAGIALFMLVLEGLASVPLVGALVQLIVLVVGVGAVLVTYFGLRVFEPVELPE